MRLTSLLLALPLIGSAFAGPVIKSDAVAIAQRDLDVLAIVTELKTTVTAAVTGVADLTVATEVEAKMNICLEALGAAYVALGVDVDVDGGVGGGILGLKRQLGPVGDDVKNQVADILVDVIVLVNTLVDGIKEDLKSLPIIAGLLAKLSPALNTLLLGVNIVLAGVLQLVAGLLSSLGINLNGLLAPVLGLLNPLVGGLLGGLLG